MARGKYLSLEAVRKQKRLLKSFCDEQPYEENRRALTVEVLSKYGTQMITEPDMAPRRAALDKLMG
jgi:hypothetical protein